jgi:hypothetical protein
MSQEAAVAAVVRMFGTTVSPPAISANGAFITLHWCHVMRAGREQARRGVRSRPGIIQGARAEFGSMVHATPRCVEHVAQIGRPIAMSGQLHRTSWVVGVQRGVIHRYQGWRRPNP